MSSSILISPHKFYTFKITSQKFPSISSKHTSSIKSKKVRLHLTDQSKIPFSSIIFQKLIVRINWLVSHLFLINDNRLHLLGGRTRGIVVPILERKLESAWRHGHQDFPLGRAQSANQIDQTIRVEHVEEAHQSRRMECTIRLVIFDQVMRGYRE